MVYLQWRFMMWRQHEWSCERFRSMCGHMFALIPMLSIASLSVTVSVTDDESFQTSSFGFDFESSSSWTCGRRCHFRKWRRWRRLDVWRNWIALSCKVFRIAKVRCSALRRSSTAYLCYTMNAVTRRCAERRASRNFSSMVSHQTPFSCIFLHTSQWIICYDFSSL